MGHFTLVADIKVRMKLIFMVCPSGVKHQKYIICACVCVCIRQKYPAIFCLPRPLSRSIRLIEWRLAYWVEDIKIVEKGITLPEGGGTYGDARMWSCLRGRWIALAKKTGVLGGERWEAGIAATSMGPWALTWVKSFRTFCYVTCCNSKLLWQTRSRLCPRCCSLHLVIHLMLRP